MKSSETDQLDRFDHRIIEELRRDGRLSYSELARRVGLSKTPCQLRVRKLTEAGYILGFRAIVDPARLGLDHIAFLEVRLSDTTEPALQAFNEAVRAAPQIEQCHMIAGSYDYLLKIRTRDIAGYRRFLSDVASNLPHLANTSTHVSMEAVKDETSRP
ncbi:hypothetical protein BV394_13035 [Brevirhabdus pacifica]|uniref:Uncharacterized protein n=1 Tax=Brevirhabdus pacifica TaxID=1267768 RepID=A0A1U7DKM7_9RHOB|nr:Lrp/AsnC family transcriptional regulator [Brevirhabdus pacifica]APX90531.1 hypothetical protein BV394_13035 [Brevirhabdus pacifica]OWU78462.1 ArsR family transcriptional regulator [Loktanella sp. 22II-4b]PJJ85347.1 AsnC family transcriptional regulator [Brevirhabdus pacifica]